MTDMDVRDVQVLFKNDGSKQPALYFILKPDVQGAVLGHRTLYFKAVDTTCAEHHPAFPFHGDGCVGIGERFGNEYFDLLLRAAAVFAQGDDKITGLFAGNRHWQPGCLTGPYGLLKHLSGYGPNGGYPTQRKQNGEREPDL